VKKNNKTRGACWTTPATVMANCERSLILWVSQMKASEEVRRVEPERRKKRSRGARQ